MKHGAVSQAPGAQFCRVPSSGRFRGKDGATRPRTFTSRPPEGCSRHISRADYTHSEARLVDIARETRSLVTRLEQIYGRHVGSAISANSPPRGKPCNEAPTQRNRYACNMGATALLLGEQLWPQFSTPFVPCEVLCRATVCFSPALPLRQQRRV